MAATGAATSSCTPTTRPGEGSRSSGRGLSGLRRDVTPIDAVAASMPTEQSRINVYFRHVWLPATGSPDPFFARPYTGRWGTTWTLHTATEVPTAWSEYCRSVPHEIDRADPTGGVGINARNLSLFGPQELSDPVVRRALYQLTFRFEKIADLTSASARSLLAASGFADTEFFSDNFGWCPALAAAGEAVGWEALVAPSAAARPDGRCVAVFNAGRRRLLRHTEIAAAARPTIATAVATTYRSGERPGWLG